MIDHAVSKLICYALRTGLIEEDETTWATNAVLDVLGRDGYTQPEEQWEEICLSDVLQELTDDAVERGVLKENSVTARDLFDTRLMGCLTPRPAQVKQKFYALYQKSPQSATNWFYKLSWDTNYIRKDRVAKDVKWKTNTEYGPLDITINLSKPEKDPREIAAAREIPVGNYPRCALCAENVGYAGRINHPARQNHRIVPIRVAGADWFLQYSPYVYYNEHCICVNHEHTPMKIDRNCFAKLLDFVRQFPHYFVGANADLPIVGGSILAHDHFQGGRYVFPMEKAPVELPFVFRNFEDVQAGIVRWPLSVIRLAGTDSDRLVLLGERILSAWQNYTDENAYIYSETNNVKHNTVTPVARMRDGKYELDLVLRNNITTEEHPLGVYHPHEELHHIKRENIGLIEVMGLAVLPSRLKEELSAVEEALVSGGDLHGDLRTAPHAEWAEELRGRYVFTADNVRQIVQKETGLVFSRVLEHAGVFKRTEMGRQAFLRFLQTV